MQRITQCQLATRIRGDEFVQVVDFNENTVFPVVADPTKHPDKTKVYYLTKKQVGKVKGKYAYNDDAVIVFKGIVCLATGLVLPYGAVMNINFVSNEVYDSSIIYPLIIIFLIAGYGGYRTFISESIYASAMNFVYIIIIYFFSLRICQKDDSGISMQVYLFVSSLILMATVAASALYHNRLTEG